MSSLTIEKLQEAIDKVNKIPKQSIDFILLTYKVNEVYVVEYKNKKYMLIPYLIWIRNEYLFERKEYSNLNQVFGIPICENDELVTEILQFIIEWYLENYKQE